jgi:AraC-like DNA-binding protein
MSALTLKDKEWEWFAERANFQPATMAAFRGISLRQVERYFERDFKKNPTLWIREFRCRRALELIANGHSNKAVARELKFRNPSHFCHEFRKVYGSSPRTVASRPVAI